MKEFYSSSSFADQCKTKGRYVLLALFVLLFQVQANAQAIKISGTVRDSHNVTLPGVSVKLKGTAIGAITDIDGKYSVSVTNTNAVLIFSFIGYTTREVTVKAGQVNDVVLSDESVGLNEVVVIGYGSVKRKDLTGSVGTVNMKDINKAPVKSFDDALAGRIAGVEVVSPDGQPGAAPNIVIRGGNSVTQDNSPLYVVDGFPIENYNNNAINPADIESIEVLKDASSTAIYGSRGANGVIIITTKKGVSGAPVVSYDGFYGLQQNTSSIKLMDPYEYVKYQLELNPATATTAFLSNGMTLDSYNDVPSIDWQKQIFHNAAMQSHNIALRGGNADTKYAVSGNILNQDGNIINSGFRRYQGRMALDQNLGKKIKVGINANYSNIFTHGTQVGGGTNTAYNLLINTWTYRPIAGGTQSLDDLLNNDQDADVAGATNYQWNPTLTAQNELNNKTTNQLTANAYLQYSFLKDFVFKVTGGVNTSNLRADIFNNSKTVTGNINSPLGTRGVNGSVTTTQLNNYVNENTLTYSHTFHKDHHLDVLGGVTIQGNTSSVFGARSIFVPNESLGISGLDEGTPYTITSAISKNNLMSYLGRVNYNYKSKYLVTANFRADGSSKFPPNNRWGYFPSGAFAWHITEEDFMKKLGFLSDTKLRASYGVTGNNRVSDFAYYSALAQTAVNAYSPGGNVISGAYPAALGNQNLKWESTYEKDLGIDLGFLQQRITFTADVYRKKTTDLLLNAQLPTSSGYSTAYENIGSVQNEGLELTLNTINVTNKTFTWSSSFNISFNRNKLLSLANGQTELQTITNFNTGNSFAANPSFDAIVGQPVAQFYGFVRDGNYQYSDFDQPTPGTYVLKTTVPNNGATRASIQPGDIKYKDLNGDGVVDNKDRTTIGNPSPKFSGGFSNNFSYKGIDLNVFLQYSYGNKVFNFNRLILEGSNTFGANQDVTFENRWTPTNQNNDVFRTRGGGPSVYSDRIVEDGSYLRLKTVNLGYTLPASMLKKARFRSIRVYLSAQNLLTWTKYTGNDPEVSIYNTALTPGVDYSAYPRAKVYTVGINLSL